MDSGEEVGGNKAEDETSLMMELPSSPSKSSMVVGETASLAPVIIEELEESEMLDVNMSEFVEAKALKVYEVIDHKSMEVDDDEAELQALGLEISDMEDHDALTATEEDILTHQFINGELTFSEYSSRMDKNLDLEGTELETTRTAAQNAKAGTEQGEKSGQKAWNSSANRGKRRRRILPPALQGLMGEANLRFARGEVDLAVQMCMEIIRQVPSAPEPFQTLSMIYETDQPEKSLQFSLIAAHLSPRDADQWLRLANLSLEADDVKQAITCYSKAIQASPTDISLYEERAKLQERSGDKRAMLKGYMKLLNQLGPEDGQNIVNYSKLLAQKYMQEDNNEQALEAMDHIFTKCPERVTLEEVNIMTELLIALKQFLRVLDVLTTYTSIKVIYKESMSENREIERCEIEEEVVVDLKAKCIVTLVELNQVHIAEEHLKKLLENEDPEVSGDLYLDIAESLMAKKEFERALTVLEALVNSKNFSLAAVWLRHAECWIGCKNVKKAMKSYEVVRELSPGHLGARIELSKLYKLTGMYDRAIEVLQQDPEVDVLDPTVIYRQALLLLRTERWDEFFEAGKLLLSRHCVHLRSKAELTSLTKTNGVRQRRDALQLYRLSLGENFEEENPPVFSKNNDISVKCEFSFFLRMCRAAFRLKRFGTLQRICFSALTSKKFEKKNSHIICLCLIACIHNNDSFHGYNLVRDLVRVYPRSNTWNLLNIVIQRADDTRHNRFIMRILGREDAFSYLQILHANNCLVSAFAFFNKYVQLRETEARHECHYNMARAFHQLGLLPGAVHHYKLVLETPPSTFPSKHPERLDLKREAAFNLHLIYMQSGNPELATSYLEDYIVV
ncbi:general transcription factor 3C polypeptide 3 isoform X2 [Venturia canescens]|uniref:general transcription factor 3C polypeptide 3 isoform X2 n=1 Tax=Venturia canescens TaxID=32260 RepID=UPI001C9BBE76|nr:general transcription factor 3C polypeptide 3 isoform X2 [Venturia canescens]